MSANTESNYDWKKEDRFPINDKKPNAIYMLAMACSRNHSKTV